MKRLFSLLFVLIFSIGLCACTNNPATASDASFQAVVIGRNGSSLLVKPEANEDILLSADKISFSIDSASDYHIGDTVLVYYDGNVMESYPAQINCLDIELVSAAGSVVSYDPSELVPSSLDAVNSFATVSLSAVAGSVTETGMTVQFTSTNENECVYGDFYCLEIFLDGQWYQVPYIYAEGAVGWDDIGYSVSSGDVSKWSVDWYWLYGQLADGQYRIVKTILDFVSAGEYDTYYLAAEFMIPSDRILSNVDATGTVTEPPTLTATYNDSKYDVQTWGYGWWYDSGDGNRTGISADVASPLDSSADLNQIIHTEASDTMILHFSSQPDAISVRAWSEDFWGNESAGAANYVEPSCDGNTITLFSGNYIYEISATWENETWGGQVNYCFCMVDSHDNPDTVPDMYLPAEIT